MKFAESFSLYKVFSSRMVLQRGKVIVFSGKASAGHSVRVNFANRETFATADIQGEWYANFPAMPAGGPFTLTVSGAAEAAPIVLEDILIGDVWFCSGQSNMQMPVGGDNPFFRAGNYQEALADADHPQIRLFQSSFRISPDEVLADESGSWQICSRETLETFSACGYFFGKQYQQDVNVPVGLISCNWGGTRIEPWISPAKFAQSGFIPFTDPESDETSNLMDPEKNADYKALVDWCKRFNEACGNPSPEELLADFDDSAWETFTNPPLVGRYLFRFTFDVPAELDGKEVSVNLGLLNDVDHTYYNGELIGSIGIDTVNYWCTLRQYTFTIRKGKGCLAIVLDNHYAMGELTHFKELVFSVGKQEYTLPCQCRYRAVHVLENFPCRPAVSFAGKNRIHSSNQYPGTLFNAMVYPWLRYKIAGILWYQGCSNAGEFDYYQLHQMLIDDWREQWHEPELPFLLVQLSAFHAHRPEDPMSPAVIDQLLPEEYCNYALTREIQAEMPKVRKNVGMIVSFDRGDHSDIHPRDKETLGFRLAKKAQQILFGSKEICDGPEFAGFRRNGSEVIVRFKNTGSGLTTSDGKPPKGFCLSGETGTLIKITDAEICGDTVVLKGVTEPFRVRYAYAGYCDVNLCNKEGYPAVPFRSDKCDYAYMFMEE